MLTSPSFRIAVDLHALQTPSSRHRGIGRYVSGLLSALLDKCTPGIEWIFYANDAFGTLDFDTRGFPVRHLPGKALLHSANGAILAQDSYPVEAIYATQLLRDEVDAVFLPSPMEGHDSAIPDFSAFPARLYTVAYDFIPLVYADTVLTQPATALNYRRRLQNIRHSDAVFAISNATRDDAVKLLDVPEENAHTIYAGMPSFFAPLAPADVDGWQSVLHKKFGIGKNFLLYNGGGDWRKNQEGLIEAFGRLPKDVAANLQLVFTCRFSDDYVAKFVALAADCGIPRGKLVLTGFVSDEELRALYSVCTLFVYPSLHEGFGLPIAEAMLCGAPTIVADNSSLPEVVGDPNALFASGSSPAMAEKITEVLRNRALLDEMREHAPKYAARFTWEHAAELMLEPMLRDLQENARRKTPANIAFRRVREEGGVKPAVALVSPFPPSKSGIADYVAELVPELAAHFSLLPVVAEDNGTIPAEAPFRRDMEAVMLQAEFEQALGSARGTEDTSSSALRCDGVFYQIGNSSWHTEAYSLLSRLGGITVLHDYSLNGLLSHLTNVRKDLSVSLDAELAHNYTDPAKRRKVRDAIASNDSNQWGALVNDDLFTNRRVFTRSLGVVVHSEATLQKAVRDHGADCEPITRIPQLMHSPPAPVTRADRNARRESLGIAPDAFVVAAVGYLHETKRSLPTLEAFRKLRDACPEARLFLVGSEEIYGGDFGAEIAKRGLQDSVSVTGYVPMEILYDYVDAADLCVSLRYPSNLETSAGLLRILSRGKACIVSNIGTFADYPDTVCVKIPAANRVVGNEADVLADALIGLQKSPERREALAHAAWEYVRRENDPARCARMYHDFFQTVYAHPHTHLRLLADYAARETATHLVRAGRWKSGKSASPVPSLVAEIIRGGRA